MFIFKLFRFSAQAGQIFKPVTCPDIFQKPAIKAFNVAVSPRFVIRDKDQLHPEVQTETNEFSERAGMVQPTTERSFIIDLHVSRNTIRFPVFDNKIKDIIDILRVKLAKFCMAGKDVNSVKGNDLAIPGYVKRCDDIKLVQKVWMQRLGGRVIDLFATSVFASLPVFHQSIALDNPVNSGKGWFIVNPLFIKVIMDANRSAKRIFSFRCVSFLKAFSGINDFLLDLVINFIRTCMRTARMAVKPLKIFTLALASSCPFINPVTGTLQYGSDFTYRFSGKV